MYEVTVTISANTSKYWASVQFEDRRGVVHARNVDKENKATINRNYLNALTDAFSILTKPCMVTVYADSDYIVAAFKNGWVQDWEKHDWKNKKGNIVRNVEQWKTLREAMAPHSARFLYLDSGRR